MKTTPTYGRRKHDTGVQAKPITISFGDDFSVMEFLTMAVFAVSAVMYLVP